MKVVKKTDEYAILKRRDDRFAVVDSNKRPINGEQKAKILLTEGLIKIPEPKAAPAEEEAPAEETAAAETEAEASEEATAE